MMTKFYIFSRKIHRIFILVISVLTILMAGTGVLLKYTFVAAKFSFIDLGLIRWIHNQMSLFFSITLVGMMLTGVVMYVFPLIQTSKPTNNIC